MKEVVSPEDGVVVLCAYCEECSSPWPEPTDHCWNCGKPAAESRKRYTQKLGPEIVPSPELCRENPVLPNYVA